MDTNAFKIISRNDIIMDKTPNCFNAKQIIDIMRSHIQEQQSTVML